MEKNVFNKRLFFVIWLIVSAAWIAFIIFHSTMGADESGNESMNVLNFFNGFLSWLGLSAELSEHIIRKAAHFTEFAILGGLTLWTGRCLNQKLLKNLMPVSFVCLLTAVVDEFIQLFSPGRSAEVADVVLDYSGSLIGMLLLCLILGIINIIRKAKQGGSAPEEPQNNDQEG